MSPSLRSTVRALLWSGLTLALVSGVALGLRSGIARLGGKRSVAEVVASLREKGVGSDLGNPAEAESVLLVAVKSSRTLELWARKAGAPHVRLRIYAFTAFSGAPGPKLREGDRQIPEGVYGVEYLNPNSSYHLSIKVDYPNAFDRRHARDDERTRLGGDIFIHGKAVTIGCIPIGDPAIEELFYYVAEAGLKKTRVIIMPVDFRKGETAPEIEDISWEAELYDGIREELRAVFGENSALAAPALAR